MEITAAEPRRKGLVQLYIDGQEAVKVDREVFLRSRLKPGDEISDEALRRLLQDSDAHRAKEKALYLLEHRSHTKKELTEKIARTAASREAAAAAAQRMEDLGLVDDEAYARNFAKELFLRKRYGPLRVKQELRHKGIDGELIEELLEEYQGMEDGQLLQENIQSILERKYAGWQEDEKLRRRAFAALQRMGYGYEEIQQALRRPED